MSVPMYYTVYLAEDDRIVAFGTSKDCASMLGMTVSSFHSTVSHVKKGINKRYEIYEEPLYHTIRKDDVQTMRDPKRIDKFCDELKIVWKRLPDWRFGQLMMNLLGEYQAVTGRDPFFPEEDEMLDFFRGFVGLQPLSKPEPAVKKSVFTEDRGSTE